MQKSLKVSNLLFYILLLNATVSIGQVPHDHPDHPKGNSAQIYKALPFYNEACELYKFGKVEEAKRSLYQAISTSFSLTEAHLFLADILNDQGKIDSAFYFYNAGLDFAIEQKPNYYFKLFDLGMKLGQYHIVKHNLKHFKKLYGKDVDGLPYEEGFPYTYADYEKVKESIAYLYNYESWLPTATEIEENIINESVRAFYSLGKSRILQNCHQTTELIQKKRRVRTRVVRGIPSEAQHCFISKDRKFAIYTLTEQEQTKLYVGVRKGKGYEEGIELPAEINQGSINAYPFLTSDNSTLYFSSNKNGSMDLFVAHIDLIENSVEAIMALDRLNSADGDEIAPYLNEQTQTFYLASNAYPGFGGFDLYECKDHELINGTILPIVPRNMGASINSFHDEMQFSLDSQNDFLLLRHLRDGNSALIHLSPKQSFEQIYFEIDTFPTREDSE